VIAILVFVLLASPYNRGPVLNRTHTIACILGDVIQLEVAVQLVRASRSARTVLGPVILLVGGGIAAAAPSDWHFDWRDRLPDRLFVVPQSVDVRSRRSDATSVVTRPFTVTNDLVAQF
jgi:hypothetical protein